MVYAIVFIGSLVGIAVMVDPPLRAFRSSAL
jgi:hypothetical protein